ncbi:hypothetical protein QUF56_12130 [Ureibacillus composti]|nr:hypothetical protein [Ureibacillus composti]
MENIPKIVYLAEIFWVVDYDSEEKFCSIVESIDTRDADQIRKTAITKFRKALEYVEQEDIVSLVEPEKKNVIFRDGVKVEYSHTIKVKNSNLAESYMSVTFRPIMKAVGWIFELNPVKPNLIFIDYPND